MSRLGDVIHHSALNCSVVAPKLRRLADRASRLKADSFGDEHGHVTWYTAEHLAVIRGMVQAMRSGVSGRGQVHHVSVLVWTVAAWQKDCPVECLGEVLSELGGYGIDGFKLLRWLGVADELGLSVEVAA